MDELETVLASYRDMFGAKTDRANEIHKAACIEVTRLQAIEAAAREVKKAYEPFSDTDHYTAVAKLLAALERK